LSILFYSGAGWSHLHSNYSSPSTLNAITWLCGELSSLASPHLTPAQQTERATLSIELLRQLWSIEHQPWQFIITLGESWFYLSTGYEQI
jgi:hypothetical protein